VVVVVTLVVVLASVASVAAAPVEAQFVQVAPQERPSAEWRRSAGQRRAVVLIQGLQVHPFSKENVEKAPLRDWQKPGSRLVKRLAADADVYAFAYGQSVPVDEVADHPALWGGLLRLRAMGYRDVVLVGHSAGGVIARRVAEDYPDAGVTKVVQVCTPNAGSGWAMLQGVRKNQKPFLQSLTKDERHRELRARLDVSIPDDVEFVCVVGSGALTGDGVVSSRSQWTPDLQAQGVPAVAVATDHLSVVRSSSGAEKIAELVRTPQPRWSQARVTAARKAILGE
jgi:pimeloyl-ACP methyl ester carboxylesterase